MENQSDLAMKCNAWPFEEARKLIKRFSKTGYPETVLFETGYGPSGLPHIGTFGEVARTSWVRHAFHILTDNSVKTDLLCFSDDMDGMRKIPENVPNREIMEPALGLPLTRVPDPFGTDESFGHHNNAKLREFLDAFGFDYTFASSTDYYAEGRFDEGLIRMLERYDDVMKVMLPTLGEERQKTYAPLLPVHPETGVVMQVPLEEINPATAEVVWTDPATNKRYQTSVLKGGCKAQWKPDWALRWAMLDVHYEMSGKDHIDNVKTSSKLCKILGGKPPEGFNYELFLDENGEKISKSKGNGITIDEWLSYAPQESISLYMYQKPKTAKRLYFDVIPRAVDEYHQHREAFARQTAEQQLNNPTWHINGGAPDTNALPVSFSMLLNLVSASNAENKDVLWGFISKYAPTSSPENSPQLDRLAGFAVRYFHDFIKPNKKFRPADEEERIVLRKLHDQLKQMESDASAEDIQNASLDVARPFERYHDPKRTAPDGSPAVTGAFFQMLYQVLLGEQKGPRFGSFVALYGVTQTVALIDDCLEGRLIDS